MGYKSGVDKNGVVVVVEMVSALRTKSLVAPSQSSEQRLAEFTIA